MPESLRVYPTSAIAVMSNESTFRPMRPSQHVLASGRSAMAHFTSKNYVNPLLALRAA